MASNLPAWPGADGAYARAGRITRNMALAGCVTIRYRRGKAVGADPSPELADFIDALNRGDEERIKALNIQYRAHDHEGR